MNNIKLKNQFEKMGIAIILNVLVMAIFYFWLTGKLRESEYKQTQIGIIVASVIELGFVIWYISWWFITANCFISPNDINELHTSPIDNTIKPVSTYKQLGVFIASAVVGIIISMVITKLVHTAFVNMESVDFESFEFLYFFLMSVIPFLLGNLASISLLFILNKNKKNRYYQSMAMGILFLVLGLYLLLHSPAPNKSEMIWMLVILTPTFTFLPYLVKYKTLKYK